MKKTLLSLMLAFSLISLANAQITITQYNMPNKFTVEYRIHDTLQLVKEGAGGTNQTWNFSTLKSHTRDTATYVSPDSTKYKSDYPQANLASVARTGGTSVVTYYSITANYFAALGSGQDTGTTVKNKDILMFTPSYKAIKLPLTYQTSFTDTAYYKRKQKFSFGQYDSLRVTVNHIDSVKCDGYGKTITPSGTFNNTLRIKRRTLGTTLIELHTKGGSWAPFQTNNDTATEYVWFSDQYRVPVAAFVYSGGKNAKLNADYLTNISKASGISQPLKTIKNSVLVSPNPASTEININFGDNISASSMEIFDLTGKRLATIDIRNSKQTILNVSNYKNGMYFYKINDYSEKTIDSGKFTVVK